MKILARVERVQNALIEQGTTSRLHTIFSTAALKAVRGGINSPDWAVYMKFFADNEEQLKRLTGRDEGSAPGYVKFSSAYLSANGTCGGLTPRGLNQFLDARLDDGIENADPDGTITRHPGDLVPSELPSPTD